MESYLVPFLQCHIFVNSLYYSSICYYYFKFALGFSCKITNFRRPLLIKHTQMQTCPIIRIFKSKARELETVPLKTGFRHSAGVLERTVWP